MKNSLLHLWVACCIGWIHWSGMSTLQAQTSLPISPEFLQAVQNGTRTLEGKPGPAYFQNRADYRIQAELRQEERSVYASEQIRYENHSPDTLYQLVIRMYQDLYKPYPGFERDDMLEVAELTEGIVLDGMQVNGTSMMGGEEAPLFRREGTNLFLNLRQALLPGSHLDLEIDWHFLIPNGHTIRMGTYGENAYFLAYWYPQIAVYDDIYGWDQLNYTGLQEFYNDFGDFEVEISAPDDFLIWATGTLQNPASVLAPTYLERYQLAQRVDTVVRIVQKNDYKKGPVARSSETGKNTWRFTASGVPDFAFAAADYYEWDATSLALGEGPRVFIDACYKPQAKDFREVAGFAREIIEGFSQDFPAIPYPYPAMTIFNGEMGGGGMEYPMMVNDASVFIKSLAFALTAHEIAHTYFPFMMGINEQRFAWMDEGWASMLPYDLLKARNYVMLSPSMDVASYVGFVGNTEESPLMTQSIDLNTNAYTINSYSKSATAYNILRNQLGDETFVKALHLYAALWEGKHPQPYDFFGVFDAAAGEDLSWFWKPWFFETIAPDLQLQSVSAKGKNTQVVVANPSGLPLPVWLTYEFKKGDPEIVSLKPGVWRDGTPTLLIERRFNQKLKSVRLGASWIPDSRSSNNRMKVNR